MTASAVYLSSVFMENVVEQSVHRMTKLPLCLKGFVRNVEHSHHIEFVTFEPTPLADVIFPNVAATKPKSNQPVNMYFNVTIENRKARPVPDSIENTV